MDSRAIYEQVARILKSRTFATKSQLKKLLEFLLKHIESQGDLNPDLVVRELWPNETRTKRSADVATEMNRLRHALEAYYEREGTHDPITIYLPNRATRNGDGSTETRWIAAKIRENVEPVAATAVRTSRALHSGRMRKIVIAITAAAVLGVAAYVLNRSRGAQLQPRYGRLDGPVLRIMNADGKELWSKTFPEGLGPDWFYAPNMGPRLWFADLHGTGETSVLFVYSPAAPQPHSTTLICYSSRGKERWRWTPGRDLPELAGSPATYKTFALAVLKATRKRPARIVAASPHALWWPTQIAILDTNGKLISEYWHSGALTQMVLADPDGDGKEEIVATGVSEYDHQATLVVLDPDQVFGASQEERPEFQIHGMGMAHEKLRLLFPRSDLNRALYQYNQATDPTFEQGHFRLTVTECIAPPGCRIWYEFEKNFRLIAAYAGGDEFRSAHNQFYLTGKNAHTLSAEEQAAFQKVRCLKGCSSDFVAVGKLVP
jgi:hypothetical protein